MALSPSTKQCIALNTVGPAGIIYTGLQVGTTFANKTITNEFPSGSGLNWTYYVTGKVYSTDANGLEISLSQQFSGTGTSSYAAQQAAMRNYNA